MVARCVLRSGAVLIRGPGVTGKQRSTWQGNSSRREARDGEMGKLSTPVSEALGSPAAYACVASHEGRSAVDRPGESGAARDSDERRPVRGGQSAQAKQRHSPTPECSHAPL